MQLFLAILVGKSISFLTRTLRIGGGSAAPGYYALKVAPYLVEKLARKIPQNIIITGTNGKTTTARMVAHFAKESGLKVIRNHTGSNLERGIASALINAFHIRCGTRFGHIDTSDVELGIWEVDEAAFNSVASKLKPDIVVFLNAFRDQLDRYGEVDSVVKKWNSTLQSLPKETLILVNGDDANTSKLKSAFGNIYKFGIRNQKIIGETEGVKNKKMALDLEAKEVNLKGLENSSFLVVVHGQPSPVTLPLPGLYHIYDFLGAFFVGHELGFTTDSMISSLKGFQPAFGRVEKLPFGYIFLIKNPAGATQVFETIAPQIKPGDRLLIALNDNFADGTDVSWIWDAHFEELLTSSRHKTDQKSAGVNLNSPRGCKCRLHFERLQATGYRLQVICSGSRAADLGLRLKYAGFEADKLIVQPDLEKALKEARAGLKGQLFILPTYTALLELQRILAKQKVKPHYWQER